MTSHKSGVKLVVGLAVLAVSRVSAFSPNPINQQRKWELREVIRGEDVDAGPVDLGEGGVRLAEESAIKIVGEVKHKPGQADARPTELLRYNALTEIGESKVNEVLKRTGSKIICTGQGQELYKNPGETLEKLVKYGPDEAVKDAITAAASALECERLVFNFLGGDDLMMGEVIDAANEVTISLDIATGAKIFFNSLCHTSIPAGSCSLTVVSLGAEEGQFFGVEKSVAAGEVYSRDGVWYTVDEADQNKDIA